MLKTIRNWFKKPEPAKNDVNTCVYRHVFKLDGVLPYTDIELWEDERRSGFFVECKRLLENETLKILLDNEIQEIANHAFMQSDAQSFFYDRFQSKGVAGVRERLEEYAARIEHQEAFDSGDYVPQ